MLTVPPVPELGLPNGAVLRVEDGYRFVENLLAQHASRR
jgi:hypothetical protein